MRRSLKVGAASLLAFIATGLAGGVAYAQGVDWGPLTASYNGQARSSALGFFYIATGTQVTNKVQLKDLMNDGNNVYSNTSFYFYGQNTSCGTDGSGNTLTCWWYDTKKSTGEFSGVGPTWTLYLSDSLKVQSSQARGSITDCVQLGWPVPDHCSANAITTLSY